MSAPSYSAVRKSSFAPVITPDTRVVVLGSLPGEASLAARQYYAHPRNQFWHLMGAVIGVDLAPLPYEGRLSALQQHHIGLWDVVARASRRGSLDSNLRDVELNDLTQLLQLAPNLRAIGCNGGESLRRVRAWQPSLPVVALPSSSPAHTRPWNDKLAVWLQLREFLARRACSTDVKPRC